MAKLIIVEDDKSLNVLTGLFFKGLQSCNINFLLGAGCSVKAIPYNSETEKKLTELLKNENQEEAQKQQYAFLKDIISVNEELYKGKIADTTKEVLGHYKSFINVVNRVLFERKTNIMHKQANIFSTNYDLFIEQAAAELGDIYLNDGFHRNTSLKKEYIFSNKEFFNYTCHSGSFFDFKVDIPSINLIKLHGSLSWRLIPDNNGDNKIIFSTDFKTLSPEEQDNIERIKEFNSQVSVVFPDTIKYQDTVLNHNYYDLIRIFSHELEKENTVLFICGFGFNDTHLEEVLKRALGNPTLHVFLFAYCEEDIIKFQRIFEKSSNVNIISLKDKPLGFDMATKIIDSSL
ncbi:hypothetical protein AAIR98_000628 [Elusimicrobium simillimum]|uniref:SIR2 family protein n=1 Tax=Elusimicrobium simillimum TaxID=3143438 RepID=UPI003C6EC002